MARVVIVGGGVIGCAVAERLSRERRHSVLLLERDRLGAHASSAAAGILSPHGEADMAGFDLAQRSFSLFPEIVDRVERSGISVEFRAQESVVPALTEEEERQLQRATGRWLDATETLTAEPALNPRVRGAGFFAEAQVTPERFVRALAATAAVQGAEIREGAPVGAITVHHGAAQGVSAPDGLIKADAVVLAAGPWSPALATPVGVAVDVRPNRGQLVMLRPRPGVLSRMLLWRGCYLVTKPDGSLVAGSTEEDAGFDARPTVEGVTRLLEFSVRAVPELATAVVERTWAALRPATADGRPIIGPVAQLPNLIVATGHNRNGILLAPVTAELVADSLR
jgi:glycine oxidase